MLLGQEAIEEAEEEIQAIDRMVAKVVLSGY